LVINLKTARVTRLRNPADAARHRRRGDRVKRRAFIALLGGAAVAWPLTARAQQGERVRRIGFPRAAPPPERELEAFMRGLADHGWVQGRNFVLVPQWGDENIARLPELAIALVNAAVDIIVAEGVTTVRAARAVTATIPIVMTGAADPFVGGLVKSLARLWNLRPFTELLAPAEQLAGVTQLHGQPRRRLRPAPSPLQQSVPSPPATIAGDAAPT
jgi:hypothetical protein